MLGGLARTWVGSSVLLLLITAASLPARATEETRQDATSFEKEGDTWVAPLQETPTGVSITGFARATVSEDEKKVAKRAAVKALEALILAGLRGEFSLPEAPAEKEAYSEYLLKKTKIGRPDSVEPEQGVRVLRVEVALNWKEAPAEMAATPQPGVEPETEKASAESGPGSGLPSGGEEEAFLAKIQSVERSGFGSATGIIIDGRGSDVQPVLFLKVRSAKDDQLLYSGAGGSPNEATRGSFGWASTPVQAGQDVRVGDRPMQVKVFRVDTQTPTCIWIDDREMETEMRGRLETLLKQNAAVILF